MTIPAGGSRYETWVITLRRWESDPTTPLDHLPPLADDTFTPETYRRLLDHLIRALDRVQERWQESLRQGFARASGRPHELARELLSLRVLLARRIELSNHPALPDGIREVLIRNLHQDVERYQQQIEDAVRRQTAAARVDDSAVDTMLRVVRENPLTGVFRLRVTTSGSRPEAAPLLDRTPENPLSPRRRGTRRVTPVIDTQ